MKPHQTYPRFAETRVLEALVDTPVVLIHGPRQCGKTTLANMVGQKLGYTYRTFDDPLTIEAATSDPTGFVRALPDRVILDEVQRVPGLFTTIKIFVDQDRKPGRFILTGSANILLLPKLADSLAGRMETIRLHPLAQCEINGVQSYFLDQLFAGSFEPTAPKGETEILSELIVAGGFPVPLGRASKRRRQIWYREYVETIVKRDIREIARIRSHEVVTKLLSLFATYTATTLNISDLASPFEVSRETIKHYVSLLEHVFMLYRLPPWHTNQMSRLVKRPKMHIEDTGLACALVGITAADLKEDRTLLGQYAETFVCQELLRMASWHENQYDFYHFRDRDDVEVDIVIEQGIKNIAGVEIKSGATVRSKDFRGLRKMQNALGSKFKCGVVMYDGDVTQRFGDKLFAVPIRNLWAAQ